MPPRNTEHNPFSANFVGGTEGYEGRDGFTFCTHGAAGPGGARHGWAGLGMARQGRARQVAARPGKAGQGKANFKFNKPMKNEKRNKINSIGHKTRNDQTKGKASRPNGNNVRPVRRGQSDEAGVEPKDLSDARDEYSIHPDHQHRFVLIGS